MDCDKKLADYTPMDALRCAYQAIPGDLTIIKGNASRMADNAASTTIGEWAAIFLAFGVLPAMLLSWYLPLRFIWLLIGQVTQKHQFAVTKRAIRNWRWSIIYLIAAGFASSLTSNGDSFMIIVGGWEMMCGLLAYIGPSYWGTRLDAEGQPVVT